MAKEAPNEIKLRQVNNLTTIKQPIENNRKLNIQNNEIEMSSEESGENDVSSCGSNNAIHVKNGRKISSFADPEKRMLKNTFVIHPKKSTTMAKEAPNEIKLRQENNLMNAPIKQPIENNRKLNIQNNEIEMSSEESGEDDKSSCGSNNAMLLDKNGRKISSFADPEKKMLKHTFVIHPKKSTTMAKEAPNEANLSNLLLCRYPTPIGDYVTMGSEVEGAYFAMQIQQHRRGFARPLHYGDAAWCRKREVVYAGTGRADADEGRGAGGELGERAGRRRQRWRCGRRR
ncbi:hypothetical protein evm_013664 [Chilo suppressalis]|nr:hypothetical protein evm_013664 [Chilo suppressalis]